MWEYGLYEGFQTDVHRCVSGARWLSGRILDSQSREPGLKGFLRPTARRADLMNDVTGCRVLDGAMVLLVA